MTELAKKVKNYYCDIDERGNKYIERALVALSKSENSDALLRSKTKIFGVCGSTIRKHLKKYRKNG